MEQKAEERLVIDLFREKWKDFPKGKLVSHESPDFLLLLAPKKAVGIELTRLPEHSTNLFDELTLAINKKNVKLEHYQNMKIQQFWLLIYTDDLQSFRGGNIQNNLIKWKFECGYNSVWLLSLFSGELFPVNVS